MILNIDVIAYFKTFENEWNHALNLSIEDASLNCDYNEFIINGIPEKEKENLANSLKEMIQDIYIKNSVLNTSVEKVEIVNIGNKSEMDWFCGENSNDLECDNK